MSHKTLINGTNYEVTGGKTLVGGTAYDIKSGRTLVNGVGYDITFLIEFTLYRAVSGTTITYVAPRDITWFDFIRTEYKKGFCADPYGEGSLFYNNDTRVWRVVNGNEYMVSLTDKIVEEGTYKVYKY